MSNPSFSDNNSGIEINLKRLFEKVYKYKFLFVISVVLCLIVGVIQIKLATPIYEAGTTLLVDPSGQSRMLGESKYLDGGVGLIEPDKNLFNEIGIIKSYDLVEQTVQELKFDVSYFSEGQYKDTERYGYFPVEVVADHTAPQIYSAPFYFEILSDSTYRLTIEAEDFFVSNPATGTSYEVKKPLSFSDVYRFGQAVKHNYFNFTVNQPNYDVVLDNFAEEQLFFEIYHIGSVTNSYLDKLEVDQNDLEGSILKLRSTGPVVEKEKDFLNRLTSNYIENKLKDRDKIALNKENFIRRQLNNISDSLAIAERSLESFRRQTQAVDLSQTASNALNQVQQLKVQKAQIELNIKYYRSQLQHLQDSASIDKILAPSVVGINDPLLNENLLELKRLYSERTRLNFIKGSQSLDLELLNQQIANSTNSVMENLRNLIQSSELSLDDINYRITSEEEVITRLPSSEKQLLNYQRKSNLYDNLFNYLSQELAKTGIAKAEDIPDARVLDEARMLGDSPIAPQKKLILALAFIIGLALPLGWIVLYDSIAETIEDIREVEAYSNIPVVASIAHDDSHSLLSVKHLSEWRVEESFRDLSASIQFLIPSSDQKIVGITSTIPGEGKSFCAINMGIHFAKGGKKVLVIDSDFRKPSLLDIYKNKRDFAEYLSNPKVPMRAVIHRHEDSENFHYIPTAASKKNPHELLSSPRLEELLDAVKANYDYIIIDSPAIGLVSDYLLMSKFIDIHLFVLRRRVSKLSFLSNMEKLRLKGGLKNVFVVFNGAVGKHFKYGYSNYEYGGGQKEGKFFSSIKNWMF